MYLVMDSFENVLKDTQNLDKEALRALGKGAN